MPSASSRAMMSVAAPVPVGTIRRIGRAGQFGVPVCAPVGALAMLAATSAMQHTMSRRAGMSFHLRFIRDPEVYGRGLVPRTSKSRRVPRHLGFRPSANSYTLARTLLGPF